MPLQADILTRRTTRFVLWSPRAQRQPPRVIIGKLQLGNPPTVAVVNRVDLVEVAGTSGLWEINGSQCALTDGQVYHYWLEVDDSRSTQNPTARISVTDPFTSSIDWRIFPPDSTTNAQPAAVVKWTASKLIDCDPGGEVADAGNHIRSQLPVNSQMVIYELPTAWAMSRMLNQPERDVATFLDVQALVDTSLGGANFSDLEVLLQGRAYLVELGVNALELLPPADSFFKREWGYDTAHYLAPDYELGFPAGDLGPTANLDLANLVGACHQQNIRFFVDMVMAFAHEEPYNHIDAQNFCIDDPSKALTDPDAWSSRDGGRSSLRFGFGSTLWRYATLVRGCYDPLSGATIDLYPARQLMLVYLTRWMRDFQIDGARLDSLENIANWDFIREFNTHARASWRQQWQDQGLGAGADARFLVAGEELSLPKELLTQGRIDALWNEEFQTRIRAAICGASGSGESTFEWTVKRAIDCRLLGFSDGSQVINYVTKHDVEGYRHERLFTMFRGLPDEQIEKRIKLAFVCLLTAVGVPMILAGEEFADQHDFFDQDGHVSQSGGKQTNPVNFSRLTSRDPNDRYAPMRRRIFEYVKRLIHFRTATPALAVNDTSFIHVDFNDGKRVIVWQRGGIGVDPVIVLANFSDFASQPASEYVVPTWPRPTPVGKKWVEITQARDVDPSWVGRETIFPWEAKVYTTV